jgi:hypothetical protein
MPWAGAEAAATVAADRLPSDWTPHQTQRTLRSVEESERDAVVSETGQIGNVTSVDASEAAGICCEIAVERNPRHTDFLETGSERSVAGATQAERASDAGSNQLNYPRGSPIDDEDAKACPGSSVMTFIVWRWDPSGT